MASRLREFPKDKVENETEYPWAKWFDGSVWKITKDEDFDIQLDTFITKVYFEAMERDLIVRVKLRDTSVIVQAFTPDQVNFRPKNINITYNKTLNSARKARVRLQESEVKELKKMKKLGYSIAEIAKHFNVSEATVRNKLAA